MTQRSRDEDQLIRFLQDHAATPPPPPVELEDRIMAAIRTESPELTPVVSVWRRPMFWMPMAMAAGLGILWISMQSPWSPEPTLTMAEQVELESFLESAWTGVVEDSETEELINL